MGYIIDTGTVSVVATLTAVGRELLLVDPEAFEITKFAVYDDEINYNLWDETHPDGGTRYGHAIENLPLLEPFENTIFQCRYPLIKDLPRDTVRMTTIDPDQQTYTIADLNSNADVTGEVNNSVVKQLKITFADTYINDIEGGSTLVHTGKSGSGLSKLGGFRAPGVAWINVGANGEFAFKVTPGLRSSDGNNLVILEDPTTGIKSHINIITSKNNNYSIDVPANAEK